MTLSKTDQEVFDRLHKNLTAEADEIAVDYILSRTPPELQEAMKEKLGVAAAPVPAPPPHPAAPPQPFRPPQR